MRQITQMVLLFAIATSHARAAAQQPIASEIHLINWESMSYDGDSAPAPVTESREIATRTLLLAGLGWLVTNALRTRRSPEPVPTES